MFPIGDDNRGARGTPLVTWALIAANVLVFLYQSTLDALQLQRFISTYGVIPAEIEHGHDLFTLLTSIFVHAGFAHIAGNMLFLWIFGDNIEQRFGRGLYLLFYVGCGLAASAAQIATNPGSTIPSVGASGAISGVMGAYVLLYPRNWVRVLVGLWWQTYVPAFVFLGIWFLMQFISGVVALNVQTAQSSGVAFWAHIGGFATGAAVAVALKPFRPGPPPGPYRGQLWQGRDGPRF
jgi:membrane associated rhomboid family serine protease